MQLELVPHPATSPAAVEAVSVTIQHKEHGLDLVYIVEGDSSRIVVPPPTKPYRTDELWRTTCFELFIRGEGETYREFNLSPSGQWAAYRFAEYRGEAEMLGLNEPPRIGFSYEPFGFFLLSFVTVDLGLNARISLCAVIEEVDGTKSYWALAHPPGKPDFHHPDCFVLELPPA